MSLPTAEEPFVVTIQSRLCRTSVYHGDLLIHFRLAAKAFFAAQHYVRLVHCEGLDEAAIVHSSFTQPQPCSGLACRSLGLAHSKSNQFLPLSGNYIPSTSTLTLSKVSGEPFTEVPAQGLTLILHVVPAHWARAI